MGVVLTRSQRELLASGLHALGDDDSVIDTAITRAMKRCGVLGDEQTLDFDAGDGDAARPVWTLSELINVAHCLGVLGEAIAKHADHRRNFRYHTRRSWAA